LRAIKYRELKRVYESLGPEKACKHLRENLEAGHLKPEDFSLRELAEAVLGYEALQAMDPRRAGGSLILSEAGDAVDVTTFANITGQIVYSKILQAYEDEAFVFSAAVETVPTSLDGEKIPGVGRIGDKAEIVAPGMPFPHFGVSEDYIETPSTDKRGLIVAVTKEAVFFDRTHLVLQRCSEVGEFLGVQKEKRLIDLAIGSSAESANTFKWKGTTYDTYSTDGESGLAGGTAWGGTNAKSSNDLVDYSDIDNALQLFGDLTDPDTGEPIVIHPKDIFVTLARSINASRIVTASEVRYTQSSSAIQTIAGNPVAGRFKVNESALLKARLVNDSQTAAQANAHWLIGDFKKAFAYMQNWPITVTQAPPNSPDEFDRDIVAKFKASERGAAAVLNRKGEKYRRRRSLAIVAAVTELSGNPGSL